ncbi:MAG: ornithine carbamoyltransferase [Bradymonadia bacterium]
MNQKRDLVSIGDLSKGECLALLRRGDMHRTGATRASRPLEGKSLAMLFSKASTRTRVSFDVGMFQLGGQSVVLSDKDSQIGRGEPIPDTARVLSGYVDGIMIRTFSHQRVETLAEWSTVPVINGLTDFNHPCQVLADLLTCRSEFGEERLTNLKVAWVGDGNNMTRSWINAARVLGFELRLCGPEDYMLADDFIAKAVGDLPNIHYESSPLAAAQGVDVMTTDVWASMGDEAEAETRLKAFEGYSVDSRVMAETNEESIFLHCLPVHRGEEVSSEVVDGPNSRVWLEAENRLHIQKAILEWTIGGLDFS